MYFTESSVEVAHKTIISNSDECINFISLSKVVLFQFLNESKVADVGWSPEGTNYGLNFILFVVPVDDYFFVI